jgi:predicted oxidoreductase
MVRIFFKRVPSPHRFTCDISVFIIDIPTFIPKLSSFQIDSSHMENEAAVNRDGSVLDYCRLKDITIQPWSPFQYGFFEGVFLGNESSRN